MSARLLLTAVLHKPPVRRTAKTGKPYLIATLRDGKGPDAKWWTVFVFGEREIEALEALDEGEPIAAAGTFEASIWAPEGREPRVNLTMTADAILSARKPKRKPTPKLESDRQHQAADGREPARSWAAPSAGGAAPVFDDDVPFAPERR